jgi:hypothetical protein
LPGCWPAHQNIGWKTQKTLQRKWNKKTKKEKNGEGQEMENPKKERGKKTERNKKESFASKNLQDKVLEKLPTCPDLG